jgi:sugar phosphate isomerase/epimerase
MSRLNARFDRRRFLGGAASTLAGAVAGAGAGLAGAPLAAIDPIPRLPARRFRVSCAAYSLRKYLDLKKPTMKLEEFIEKCAKWGADGVELTKYYFPEPVTIEYALRLKRLAAIWGVDITGTPIGNKFTLPPGPERDHEVESVRSWIDLSAELGSPAIRIFAGDAKGGDPSQARKWVVECIESCCERASRRGVFLAVENHGGVVATADGLLEIVKAVKCEWVGVNLDTGNFQTEDPYADMARCAPYAVTCQVKTEIHRKGEKKKQDADLKRIAEVLRQANYRGYVTLEHEADEEPLEAVPRHLERLREAVSG